MSNRGLMAALCALGSILFSMSVGACESCRCNMSSPETGGVSGLTAGSGIKKMLDEMKAERAKAKAPDKESGDSSAQTGEKISESPADQAMQSSKREEAAGEAPNYRWLFTFGAEYRSWRPVNTEHAFAINNFPGGHTHGYLNDQFYTERLGYAITDDLNVGVSEVYRSLVLKNVEDADHLGRRETFRGVGDLDFDLSYRFLHQSACMPVDVAIFANAKPATGFVGERNQSHELADAEDQPGTGSFDWGGGFSASKRWGDWGASSSISYTQHNVGSQHFKNPDAIRSTAGMGRRLPWSPCDWKTFGNFGVQDIAEFHGSEFGRPDRNHGGQTLFLVPGVAVRPSERLIFSLSCAVPVYQDLLGFHQKQNFTVSFGAGVKF